MVKRKKMWRWFLIIGLLGISALVIAFLLLDDPKPTGKQGSEAENLAAKMLDAIDHEAWKETGAVSWTFAGKRHLVWDIKRQLVKVNWGDNEAYVKIDQKTGTAFKEGQPLAGEEGDELIKKAWEIWVNDAFWLNPVSKIYDPGTSRSLVPTAEGNFGLLVEYSSGGSTPGDAYLWEVDSTGLPYKWRMWVSSIPMGGMEATWENWIETDTGVKISTLHKMSGMELKLTDVKTAADLVTLTGEDIFAGKF